MKRLVLAAVAMLSPGPVWAVEFISFGPKAYQMLEVKSKYGVNTKAAHAKLVYNAHTVDAICLRVDLTKGPGCFLRKNPWPPEKEVKMHVSANCRTGIFFTPIGGPIRFMGRNKTPGSYLKYLLTADGNPLIYPAHQIALSTFQALCPARAPLPDAG